MSRIESVSDRVFQNEQAYGLPQIVSIERVLNGLAHHVFRLDTGSERFYLKIRGESFSHVPQIKINPDDIEHEHRATLLLSRILPDNFPHVVFYDKDEHFLILTDAVPNGEILENLFLKGEVTPSLMRVFGETLRRVHEDTIDIEDSIRGKEEDNFMKLKLQHRFGYRNNPVLDKAVSDIIQSQPYQIILGDPSPKNIGVNDNEERIVFFDLEDVHRGAVVFDVGLVVGHILLHLYPYREEAADRVDTFFDGYGKDSYYRYLKAIALGAILYRINGPIPYRSGLNPDQKTKFSAQVESALNFHNLEEKEWDDLINFIFK